MSRTMLGFGFGPIQAGLFFYEAWRTGRFGRFVVADVVPELVDSLNRAGGAYRINIATAGGIEHCEVRGVQAFNSRTPAGREALAEAAAGADEIVTALPSVSFYGAGEPGSVVDILSEGLRRRLRAPGRKRTVIYTAENNNRAAEILEAALRKNMGADADPALDLCQCLNTVIGKMSGVVTDAAQAAGQRLESMTPGYGRCFLVEEFNRILITSIRWPDFERGITVFEEKPDLLPFEEAKLFGHNATHALMGFLARRRGLRFMDQIRNDSGLFDFARRAFIEESGAALCRRHAGIDPLFTAAGYRAYAEDLLSRMMNPHLRDSVERVVRDPRRKLGWEDRLLGTIRVALGHGVRPDRYAAGAAAALEMLAGAERRPTDSLLSEIFEEARAPERERAEVAAIIRENALKLAEFS